MTLIKKAILKYSDDAIIYKIYPICALRVFSSTASQSHWTSFLYEMGNLVDPKQVLVYYLVQLDALLFVETVRQLVVSVTCSIYCIHISVVPCVRVLADKPIRISPMSLDHLVGENFNVLIVGGGLYAKSVGVVAVLGTVSSLIITVEPVARPSHLSAGVLGKYPHAIDNAGLLQHDHIACQISRGRVKTTHRREYSSISSNYILTQIARDNDSFPVICLRLPGTVAISAIEDCDPICLRDEVFTLVGGRCHFEGLKNMGRHIHIKPLVGEPLQESSRYGIVVVDIFVVLAWRELVSEQAEIVVFSTRQKQISELWERWACVGSMQEIIVSVTLFEGALVRQYHLNSNRVVREVWVAEYKSQNRAHIVSKFKKTLLVQLHEADRGRALGKRSHAENRAVVQTNIAAIVGQTIVVFIDGLSPFCNLQCEAHILIG